MDVIERLTLEAAQANTLIACEHRHRYEFAARLCAGSRVLDLACGSGYGSEILAEAGCQVLGVDNDAATIDLAQGTVGRRTDARFEAADAVAFLRGEIEERFDAIVCFEGLEHLHDLKGALGRLRELADAGVRQVLSVPNSKAFEEENPHHVTDFGYESMLEAFAPFEGRVVLPQFLAEGSLIVPPGADGVDVGLALEDRVEPEYANHFIVCLGFPEEDVTGSNHGRMQLNSAPSHNRYMRNLERANAELVRTNVRLTRQRLGKADSAAATYLAKKDDELRGVREETAAWQQRAIEAETRLARLEPAGGGRLRGLLGRLRRR